MMEEEEKLEHERHTLSNAFQKDAKEDAWDVRVEVGTQSPIGPGDDKICYVSINLSMGGWERASYSGGDVEAISLSLLFGFPGSSITTTFLPVLVTEFSMFQK